MKWLRRNLIKIILILLHAILLSKLLLDAYAVEIPDNLDLFLAVLRLAVPMAMILAGLIGMIRDFRFKYLLMALLGGLILWQSYEFDLERLVGSVRLINDRLAAARPLYLRDFAYLVQTVTLVVVAVSFLTLYIYPWNLIITDLAFLFFLWAVDNLPDKNVLLVPFVFFWGFLLVHERMTSRDALYAEYGHAKISRRSRLLQGVVITVLIGAISLGLIRDTPGVYYDKIWIRANDYMMQDDFLAGNFFLDAFSLVRTGYKDSSTSLGGDVAINNELALRVGGDLPPYLRGNTKYRYTGRLWEKNDMLYRTDNSASDLVTDAYGNAPIREMVVVPEAVVTSSLFVPSYPASVISSDPGKTNRVFYGIQDQTFMVNDPLTEAYRVTYYDEARVEALAMAELDEAVPASYEKYLELPDTVTDRTRQLVASLIADLPDKGDRLVAITNYLRENYFYTLTPGRVPAGQDFVDYFLFEGNSGYCVYYATALTVMLRIAGIPARYAEGFKVPPEVDGEGYALIRNSDAHAWTEVLTDSENDLWTIWDATGTARDFEAGGSPGSNPDPATTPGSVTTPPRTLAEDTLPDPTTGPDPGVGPGTPDPALARRNALLVVPAALAALLALAWYLKQRRTEALVRELSGRALLDYVVTLFRESGMEVADSQTLTEIARQIVDPDLKRHFLALVREHYETVYGGQSLRIGEAARRQLLAEAYRVYAEEHSRTRTWLRKNLL